MANEREIKEKLKEVLRGAKPDQLKNPAPNQKNRRGYKDQINGDVFFNQSVPFFIGQGRQNDNSDESATKPISIKAKLPAGSLVVLPIIPFVITIGGSANNNSDIFPNGKISAIQNNIPTPKSDITITAASLPMDCHTYNHISISIRGCSRCINTQKLIAPDLSRKYDPTPL